MVVDARMHLVRRQGTGSTAAPAVPTEQVVHLSSGLPTPRLAKHHLAPPTRPLPHLGVFPPLARLLAGPTLLAL
jgi:hypothetical protein